MFIFICLNKVTCIDLYISLTFTYLSDFLLHILQVIYKIILNITFSLNIFFNFLIKKKIYIIFKLYS